MGAVQICRSLVHSNKTRLKPGLLSVRSALSCRRRSRTSAGRHAAVPGTRALLQRLSEADVRRATARATTEHRLLLAHSQRYYQVTDQQIDVFHRQGFLHLQGVLTEDELQQIMDPVYTQFLNGSIAVPGSDVCDMSGAEGRTREQYTVYNVMLPRTHYQDWQGSIFEQRCQDIANQLQGGNMEPDYDQILAKRPQSSDAVFAWHQDMAYWPPTQASSATATCWLAVSDATLENGCMRFIAGSHLEPELRPHAPVASSRAKSHALCTPLQDTDCVAHVPIARGDITVHNERVMHGSGPNLSPGWRKAYVLAFRKKACIAEERALGFTHSHNDQTSWDAFHDHRPQSA